MSDSVLRMPTSWEYKQAAFGVWFPHATAYAIRQGEFCGTTFRWHEGGCERIAAVDDRMQFVCFLNKPPWEYKGGSNRGLLTTRERVSSDLSLSATQIDERVAIIERLQAEIDQRRELATQH